jgi:hypothetical protein
MPTPSPSLRLHGWLLFMLSWLALVSAAVAHASTDPQALFAAMRAASGGDRWAQVGEIRSQAIVEEGNLRGHERRDRDTRRGRYVTRSDVGVNKGSVGFDGRQSWMQDEKGLVNVLDATNARRQAVTDAYLARNGWFASASRDPAVMTYLGEQRNHEHRFQRVRVTPAGGDPVEAWIDADTHLLARLARNGDNGLTTTTYYADYRTVDGLRLPFRERDSNGETSYDSTRIVHHVEVLAQAVDADFARPSSVIRDARIVGGAASATVPFVRYAGLILVELAIDGHAPMPFILDSGGLNLLTPDAARALGIQGEGKQAIQGVGTRIQSMQVADVRAYRLGPVQLDQQRFLIVDLPLLLTDRGDRPAIAGLIGYELLRRFTTRIDYDRQQLTFTAAGGLSEATGANVLPLGFDGRTPMVHARVNGIDGVFMMDTGDSGGLTVFAPFAAAHRITLDGKISASHSGGVGGIIESRRGQVASLALGQRALLDVPTTLSAPQVRRVRLRTAGRQPRPGHPLALCDDAGLRQPTHAVAARRALDATVRGRSQPGFRVEPHQPRAVPGRGRHAGIVRRACRPGDRRHRDCAGWRAGQPVRPERTAHKDAPRQPSRPDGHRIAQGQAARTPAHAGKTRARAGAGHPPASHVRTMTGG